MKSSVQQALRTAMAILTLAGLGLVAATGTAWFDGLGRLPACGLLMLALATVFAAVFRRLHNEDRITRLEANLCRERNARTQADHALAEADLLLARLASRSRMQTADPVGQMCAIQAELTHLQLQIADEQPQLAQRLEQLRRRVERTLASLRNLPRAAEPG